MCYINGSRDLVLRGHIGDDPSNLELRLYTDADLAGDRPSFRSTTGVLLVLQGPNTWFPLAAISKRQGCVSASTPEAELVAAAHGLRTVMLPQLDLWERILQRRVHSYFAEDNTTAIQVMKTGESPTMRHLGRTHGISLKWIAEAVARNNIEVYHEQSDLMAADIFTKAYTSVPKWTRAISLIGLHPRRPVPGAMLAAPFLIIKTSTSSSSSASTAISQIGKDDGQSEAVDDAHDQNKRKRNRGRERRKVRFRDPFAESTVRIEEIVEDGELLTIANACDAGETTTRPEGRR
jgi:hypothetical protein